MTKNYGVMKFRLYEDNQVIDEFAFEKRDLLKVTLRTALKAENINNDLWIIKPNLSEWLENKVK